MTYRSPNLYPALPRENDETIRRALYNGEIVLTEAEVALAQYAEGPIDWVTVSHKARFLEDSRDHMAVFSEEGGQL